MDDTDYVYVLVRKDLPFSQQAVQSCHACIESAIHFPCPNHPHLVLATVHDERALDRAAADLENYGLRFRVFREDDLGGEGTALATEPVRGPARLIFRKFQLLKGEPRE